jgi:hypothetical protein
VNPDSFNAETEVAGDTITLVAHSFANGMKVKYYAHSTNTALTELGNNNTYYVANTTTDTIKLTSNPRIFTYSFNSNSAVNSTSDFITLTRHNFQNNDIVKYSTAVGNTALSGLANNGQYYVVSANSAGVKLSAIRGGSAANVTNGLTQNGHYLAITTINITDGNGIGHFIAQVNET